MIEAVSGDFFIAAATAATAAAAAESMNVEILTSSTLSVVKTELQYPTSRINGFTFHHPFCHHPPSP